MTKTNKNINKDIVFYSEGAQYFYTFKPVLDKLHSMRVPCTYLSSDTNDPGLVYKSDFVLTHYIGKGNKAFMYLNLLEAKVVALTTPNLDTLQLRRSKGVGHYTHLIHAPTDIHLYKLFAFDFYDSIMVSGPHQEKSLRHLEQVRGTKPKQIIHTGCAYLDVLAAKYAEYMSTKNKSSVKELSSANVQSTAPTNNNLLSDTMPTILLAPTWGASGLLTLYGSNLLTQFLKTGYKVIVRPHPQSYIVEAELLADLEQEFAASSAPEQSGTLSFDKSPDNFASLAQADILISERSGIIFDFAFVFNKPVLIIETNLVTLGMEGSDIPWQAWELEVIQQLGESVSKDAIDTIADKIQSILENPAQYRAQISALKEQYLYNYGHSADIIAETLLQLKEESVT